MKGTGCRYEDQERSKGRRSRKDREKEIAASACPLWVSIPAPVCALPERSSEGGSALSTAHRGDQAWQPASCTSSVRLQPTGGTLTHEYISLWDLNLWVYIEICCFSQFSTGLLLAAGK